MYNINLEKKKKICRKLIIKLAQTCRFMPFRCHFRTLKIHLRIILFGLEHVLFWLDIFGIYDKGMSRTLPNIYDGIFCEHIFTNCSIIDV